ncbi:MAG: hypothetical protein C4524_04460 [Candidatus Zixiibacteriota bacterium]|nr:MAG: hypothetical protein C4524_04460 [candidate division Zixibacteria bacterium]
MAEIKQISRDPVVTPAAHKIPAPVEKAGHDPALQPARPDQSDRDQVQVDRQRVEEARLEESARLLLEELPEVRPDRVAEARRRLAQGHYDRPEVLEQTAGKIAAEQQETAARKLKDDSNSGLGNPVSGAENEAHVERTRSRLAAGYYDQVEILDEVARHIVDKHL